MNEQITTFYIQPGHAKVLNARAQESDDFRDLFPKMFSERDESMYLFWNEIPIRFHYAFDCFASMGNCIELLAKIAQKQAGEEEMIFVTNHLSAKWEVSWDAENLTIHTKWHGKDGLQAYADVLNKKNRLRVNRERFLAEWKLPLVQVLNMIDSAKARNLNDSIESKVAQAGTVLKAVRAFGQLYEKS